MKAEWLVSVIYLMAAIVFFLFGVAISPVVRNDIEFIDSSRKEINNCECDHEKL